MVLDDRWMKVREIAETILVCLFVRMDQLGFQ